MIAAGPAPPIEDEAERRGFERARDLLMSDDAFEILSRVCFQCISLAQALRADGVLIKKRAEDEQAAVLRWMLMLLFEHGSGWREAARAEVERMADLMTRREAAHG